MPYLQYQSACRNLQWADQAYYLQLQSLKEAAVDLARLEMQVKKITATDTIINSCDQCVGKYLNLCGRCMLYIGEHIKKHPNSSKNAQKSQSDIVFFDEGQEDAYWL